MLVSTAPRTVDPVLQQQATVRTISLMVADTVIALFDGGRWSDAWPLAAELRQLASLVFVLDAEIGDVSIRSEAERRVEAMASSAHQLVLQARAAHGARMAVLSPSDCLVLMDPYAETLLVGAYALLAIEV